MKPIIVSKVYDRYRNGGSFTNAECLAVMEHFDALAKLLNISGDPFLLAFKEANRIYLDFYDFAKARKLI